MDAAAMIRTSREAAGLSKRELARRSATSAAALVEYESGRRAPNADTLLRVVRAAGADVRVDLPTVGRDDERQAQRLLEVLRLAEHLPRRPAARRLACPPFPT